MLEVSELLDYAAIKKLATAVWRQDINRHGAAILIGAGFSRCAAHHVDGKKKLPLWQDLAKRLADELDAKNKELVLSDPLRLAEEYRAYFGQMALNDLIRTEINDTAWQPGELHRSMLRLPWSEVMTTNWDTLLERAAQTIHTPVYGLISNQSDISCVRSPRIIKLHGSIGVTERFIVAQEDYRKYPQQFARFVNFARQVFIENELCLLGFSGDDPNFLQWIGWVRDNLADDARKIYLVGALHLTAAKRKFLESINIAPIDLWDTVNDFDDPDLRHQRATEIFLQALRDLKPPQPTQWKPTNLYLSINAAKDHTAIFKDHAYAASLLEGQIKTLQLDRESYPDWLTCPPRLRWKIQQRASNPYPTLNNIASLTPDSRSKLLYEIAWQHTITFESPEPWLIEEFVKIADPDKPCVLTKRQQLEVALLVLRNTRRLGRKDETVKEDLILWVNDLLEKHAQYLPDCAAEIAYHKILVARDSLDYSYIEANIKEIIGEDPVWKLRQASLLAELGRFDDGKRLISEAYKELRERHRLAPNSIRILSRLAWAHWLLHCAQVSESNETLEALPATYKDWDCDPVSQIEHLENEASEQKTKYLNRQQNIEPLFAKGHYRDHSNKVTFSNEISLFSLFDGFTSVVGMPLRWNHVNFLVGPAEKLISSGSIADETLLYILAIRASSDDSSPALKEVFSRIGLARASQTVADTLIEKVMTAIDYWRIKRSIGTDIQSNYALDRIRVLVEVLARLLVRASLEKAKEAFCLAMALGRDRFLQHIWLVDVINHLAEFSLESIPESRQGELLLDALSFPLQLELEIEAVQNWPAWPNPVIRFPGPRENDPRLSRRLDELIDYVTPGSPSCDSALLRLLPLAENGFLSKAESTKLANKIWGHPPNYDTLPRTKLLLPHALWILPAPDRDQANSRIKRYLFEADDALLLTDHHLLSVTNAAANRAISLLPSEKEAVHYFDRLVVWRPSMESDDPLGLARQERMRLINSIGNALSYSIVPALPDSAVTSQRFEQLLLFKNEVGSISVIPALIYFTNLGNDIANKLEKMLRTGLQGQESDEVSYSAIALLKWKVLAESGKAPHPNSLLTRLVYLIESGRPIGLQQLLWTAGEMLKKKWVSADDVMTLTETLPNLFDAADYQSVNPISLEAISASSIREACVRLAKDIIEGSVETHQKLDELIHVARTDALPEVRFAASPLS